MRSKSNHPNVKIFKKGAEPLQYQKALLSPRVERTLEKSESLKAFKANNSVVKMIHDNLSRLYG